MASQYFTIEEASQHLPWLREVFEKAVAIKRDILHRQETLQELIRRSRRNGESNAESEVAEAQKSVNLLIEEVEQLVEEIARKGIVVRDLERGLVDFPALRDDREVHLCWLWGEEEIGFWHDVDAGFASRQPI